MLKMIHVLLALLSLGTFLARVFLESKHTELFAQKWVKIGPHILNTFLLLSGFTLVLKNDWLAGDFSWILAKLVALVGYIGFGMVTIKSQGDKRWQAFAGAIACYVYILAVAGSKNALIFL